MRFIHTGDLHFGGSKILPTNLERQESAFDQIFDIAYEQEIDTVVVAGDWFDESDPEAKVRDLVERKILEYDAAGFRILGIPGNHDMVDRSGYTALHYLAMLSKSGRLKNSVIVEETAYVHVEDTVFCLMVHPYGKFTETLQDSVQMYHESSLQVGADNFVVVGHETIRGSQTDIKLKDGNYFCLEQGAERPDMSLDVTYFALGDLHMCQSVGERAFYSGAPLQIKFGDAWPKGVLVVDTDDPNNPKFAAIETNQMVKASPGEDVPANSYVKLKVKSKEDILSVKSTNVVRWEVDSPKVSLSLDVNGSIRDRLIDGVKQQGAKKKILSLAVAEIESLLLSVPE